jgi:hypothetical protein
MERLKVYISGPITSGNRNHNFAQAADAQKQLMLAGFAPFNPMATMTLPFAWDADVPHGVWLDCDFPWVAAADAVLRLPGYSVGADAELQHAEKRDVPIFHGIDQLIEWRDALLTEV